MWWNSNAEHKYLLSGLRILISRQIDYFSAIFLNNHLKLLFHAEVPEWPNGIGLGASWCDEHSLNAMK